MTIPVFYVPQQSARTKSLSPSGHKPELVVQDWTKRGLSIEVRAFERLHRSEIAVAHDPEFVNSVIDLQADNGFGNRDRAISESLFYTTASMVAAARHCARERVLNRVVAACSPTSGFHHAGYGFAGGFCTFNGLMIAAISVLASGLSSKVGIIDYDYHYGDGTEDILHKLDLHRRVFHYTAGGHFTEKSQAPHLLRQMHLPFLQAKDAGVDLILYQAGADQHKNDRLGGILSTEELTKRDRIAFQTCKQLKLPVAWNLAGGYQVAKNGSIDRVLTIHRNTMTQCIDIFGETQ